MLLILRPIPMFVLKGPKKCGFCPLFEWSLCSFFEGVRSFAQVVFLGPIFFQKIMCLAFMMRT